MAGLDRSQKKSEFFLHIDLERKLWRTDRRREKAWRGSIMWIRLPRNKNKNKSKQGK